MEGLIQVCLQPNHAIGGLGTFLLSTCGPKPNHSFGANRRHVVFTSLLLFTRLAENDMRRYGKSTRREEREYSFHILQTTSQGGLEQPSASATWPTSRTRSITSITKKHHKHRQHPRHHPQVRSCIMKLLDQKSQAHHRAQSEHLAKTFLERLLSALALCYMTYSWPQKLTQ